MHYCRLYVVSAIPTHMPQPYPVLRFQFACNRPGGWTSGGHSFWFKRAVCTKLAHHKLGTMSVWVCSYSLACILLFTHSGLKEAHLQRRLCFMCTTFRDDILRWKNYPSTMYRSSCEPASDRQLTMADVLARLHWPFSEQWFSSSLPCGWPVQSGLVLAFLNAPRKDSATWPKYRHKS